MLDQVEAGVVDLEDQEAVVQVEPDLLRTMMVASHWSAAREEEQ